METMSNTLNFDNNLPEFNNCDKKVYTISEIQDILGISLSSVYKVIKSKQFHSVKVGHRVLISKKSFDEWLHI